MHDATMAMMGCQRLDRLLDVVVSALLDLSAARAVLILLPHETGDHLECVAAGGDLTGRAIGARYLAGEGHIGLAWSSGLPRLIPIAASEAGHAAWPNPMQAYVHPFAHRGDSRGVVVAYAPASGDMPHADIDTLGQLSQLAGIAIHNVQSAESVAIALTRTHALGEISRELVDLDNATEACDAACRMLLSAADISRVSSFLVDGGGALQPHVSWEIGATGTVRSECIPAELVRFSIAQRAMDQGCTVAVSRNDRHAPQSRRLDAILRQRSIGSALAIPLLKAGTPIGAIVVTRELSRRDLSETEVDVCLTVVHQLSTTLERSDLARELVHRAWHDGLTGLPNRSRFETRLVERLHDTASSGAVLFVDLDGFKRINDSLGHAVGDALLQHVSRRLQSKIKHTDLLARMGGDEFAILLSDRESADRIAARFVAALNAPFTIDGERMSIGASLGICEFPRHGRTIDTLLRHADVAMYEAKHRRGGGVVRFEPDLLREGAERELLEAALRQAVQDGQFELAYQPQVSCADGRVVGMEALIRWHDPQRGLVLPDEFIPIAEASGLIDRIGDWVIHEAAQRLAAWRDTPLAGRRLSINIAASQFQQSDFVDNLLATLAQHDAPADLLELELTETSVMQHVGDVARQLQRLRDAGLRIAIDDFGTGYSSLSYLQDLPLDVLKIDRTFVTRLQDAHEDEQTLVNTILLLSAGLGLASVAEGVETQAQADAVARWGCNAVQGNLHSAPVFERDLTDTVIRIERQARHNPRHAA